MNRKPRSLRMMHRFETLEQRSMFAALAGLDAVNFCTEIAPSALLGNSVAGSTNLESGGKGSKSPGGSSTSYTYSVTGNAADAYGGATNASLPAGRGGLALVGGGTDVDAVFRWMGAKAGGGDFVVLRATGTNAYNSYIDALVPSLDSVATIIIPNRTAANETFVADKISRAEAIFIAGGDQANYINFWKGTGVETALYAALQRHVPIGGTSAGLAVLGDVDFSAIGGTITSSEALAHPQDPRITLDTGFLTPEDTGGSGSVLQWVDNVIMEPHFMQRDRMGRLMTFMSDMSPLVTNVTRGIAVNEQTALLVEEADGTARVVGNAYSKKLKVADQQRSVYLLGGSIQGTLSNAPLTYQVNVQRAIYDPVLDYSDTFSLSSWAGVSGSIKSYDVIASNGVLSTNAVNGSLYG